MNQRIQIEALLRDMGEPISYDEIRSRMGSGLASALMEMVQEGIVVEHPGAPKRYSLQ